MRRNGDLLQPYPLEAQLETLPDVARAAAVARKNIDGVIIVEPDEKADCEKIRATIRRNQAVQTIGEHSGILRTTCPLMDATIPK